FSNDFALDQNAPGYRYIRLNNDGSFETKVFRLENFKTRINTDISGY
ncbi:metallophosphatase, partial [Acinetobacter baumannii]